MPTKASPFSTAVQSPLPNRRMAELIAELAQDGEGFCPSTLPGVKLMRSVIHVPRSPIAYEPGVVIMAQGRKSGHLAERSFIYDPNHYLVLTAPLPFECETFGTPESPVLGLFVGITPALVSELVLQLKQFPATAGSPQLIDATPLDPALSGAAIRLLECLRSANDTAILGPQIVREIVYLVLRGPLGGNLRALAAPQSFFGQISRVLNRLHLDFAQTVEVEDLAREAGMSVSTFHAHFKTVTAASPLQYLKALRLHKARMLMVHDGANAGTAAHHVGYESVSQFSREFKRLFGASPSIIAQQLCAARVRLA